MNFVWAFLVGGLICVVGQLLIDLTKLTPARILVLYVVAGVVLSALGWYDPLVDFAGAGATVPLIGFGHLLAQQGVQAFLGLRIFQFAVFHSFQPFCFVRHGVHMEPMIDVAYRELCDYMNNREHLMHMDREALICKAEKSKVKKFILSSFS